MFQGPTCTFGISHVERLIYTNKYLENISFFLSESLLFFLMQAFWNFKVLHESKFSLGKNFTGAKIRDFYIWHFQS